MPLLRALLGTYLLLAASSLSQDAHAQTDPAAQAKARCEAQLALTGALGACVDIGIVGVENTFQGTPVSYRGWIQPRAFIEDGTWVGTYVGLEATSCPPQPYPNYRGPVFGWCGTFSMGTDIEYLYVVDMRSRKAPPCGVGNPIDPGNGIKCQSEVVIEGPRLPYTLRYRSDNLPAQVTPTSPASRFGPQWTDEYSMRVFALPVGASSGRPILVTRPDGRALSFTNLSGSGYTPAGDIADRLDKVVDGSGTLLGWTFTTADDTVERYDASGALLTIASRDGQTKRLEYSDGTASGPNGGTYVGTATPLQAGLLLRVIDSFGARLTFAYAPSNRVAEIQDAAGASYGLAYDSNANLVSITFPDGRQKQFVYNEPALTSGASLVGALTGVIDENNKRFASFGYNGQGRAISTERAGGAGRYSYLPPNLTDPLGTQRGIGFSSVVGIEKPNSMSLPCPGCELIDTRTITYDAKGNVSSRLDFKGNLTRYAYDARNHETQRVEGLTFSGAATPVTRTTTTQWHPTWHQMTKVAEPKRVTTFVYNGDTVNGQQILCAPPGTSPTGVLCSKAVQATTDENGGAAFAAASDGPPRTWGYTYNAQGQLLSVDGPRTDVSDVTAYSYYAADDPGGNYRAGDLASIANAKSQVTRFTHFDRLGRVKRSVDPNGLEVLFDYFPRGWLRSRQAGSSATGFKTTSYDYDFAGQLTKVTSPDGSFIAYTYDDAHRLTDIRDGLGNRIHYTLDGMGNRTAEETFDSTGALARAHTRVINSLNLLVQDVGGTSPAAQATQHGYDDNGNLSSTRDPLGRTTTRDYDRLNRLTAINDPFNGTASPTRYEYDGLDRITKITDPKGLATTYVYNGHLELISQNSPDTGITTFTYDSASNIKTKLDARGVQAAYAYDELNRVTGSTFPDETVTYAYDACSNGMGRLCSFTDRSGTTTYAYDLWGRIISKTQSVGGVVQSIAYAYNSAGQLTSVTTPGGRQVVYGYANNQATSVTLDGVKVLDGAAYEPFGPIGGWRWGNSTATAVNMHTRIFDRDYRPTRITSDLPAIGTQPALDMRVGWDGQSRVQTIEDLANAARSAAYGYDALDRLGSVTQGSTAQSFTYDGVGNRLTSIANGATTAYTYVPGSHRLQNLVGAQTRTFAYDSAGNATSDGANTWVYGGNNRVSQAGATAFAVNALGQRVKKSHSGGTTHFFYGEAGQLWGDYDETGRAISETVWLDALPVAVVKPNRFLCTATTVQSTSNTDRDLFGETLVARFGANGPRQKEWQLGSASSDDLHWSSGTVYRFVLTEDGNGGATLAVFDGGRGRVNLTSSGFGAANGLDIRLAAASTLPSNASMSVSITKVDGQTLGGLSWTVSLSNPAAQLSLLRAATQGPLTVEGTISLTFRNADRPAADDLRFELRNARYWCSGAPTIAYVHSDHLGTPRMITHTSDNAMLWRWENTEPFGNAAPDENPSGLGPFTYNLRFPGQHFDAETGTHYNYFRDYDPAIGRYVQSDPIGLRGGINTYGYVEGSPLAFVDTEGLWVKRCSRELGGKEKPPINYDTVRKHDYLNVSGTILSFGPAGNMLWGKGRIGNDEYQDKGCRTVCNDNAFDSYVFAAADTIGIPTYCVLAGEGTLAHSLGARNCQAWANDVINLAKQNYLKNEPCPKCFR